jgi:hypothetical protein
MSHPTVIPLPVQPPVPVSSVQGTLALDLQPRQDPPELRRHDGRRSADVIDIGSRTRGEAEQWVHRYAQAAVEIVGGDRPVSQLLRWSSREVFEDLDRRARLVAHAGRHQPGQGRVQPVRPRVQGVRTCFLSHDVLEVSVRIRYGERSRALAARFERLSARSTGRWIGLEPERPGERRWCCTALEFA